MASISVIVQVVHGVNTYRDVCVASSIFGVWQEDSYAVTNESFRKEEIHLAVKSTARFEAVASEASLSR
jgi:hypothetical protein